MIVWGLRRNDHDRAGAKSASTMYALVGQTIPDMAEVNAYMAMCAAQHRYSTTRLLKGTLYRRHVGDASRPLFVSGSVQGDIFADS